MLDRIKAAERARDGRSRTRGARSPRSSLADRWRAPFVAVLGAWLAASPWLLGISRDTHSTQSAVVSGGTLVWAALWALTSLRPAPAHAIVVAVGGWLLLAPSLWYFGAAAASWNSITTGLVVVALSASALAAGPWTRPPVGGTGFDTREGP